MSIVLAPIISFSGTKYKKVNANSVDDSGGIVIPNGEKHAVYRFIANGSDPNAYVSLIWDYGGDSEKIILSTKGDVDIILNIECDTCHITGDGSKMLKIIITNDNDLQSPIIGGLFELIKV